MIMPSHWEPLQSGDQVDLVTPSSPIPSDLSLQVIFDFIESWGLKPNLTCLPDAFYTQESKAIWCIRGGYGSMKLLPDLKKSSLPERVKLFIGFSDITAMHLFLHQVWGWETIHGEMLSRWCSPIFSDKLALLKAIVLGHQTSICYDGLIPLNLAARAGPYLEAPIVAGNLALFQTSIGTSWQVQLQDKCLVIEEVSEAAYRIDRMLEQLKQANILKGVRAIIFADMATKMDQKAALEIQSCLIQFANNLKIPVYEMKDRFGHGDENQPLPFGGRGIIRPDMSLTCFFRSSPN